MHMVRHQAVGVQPTLRLTQQSTQVKQIKASILVLKEAALAIVASVSDVHRDTGKHETGASRHNA
jgi:hypothetical protein